MRNFTIYLTGLLCLILTSIFAQDPSQKGELAKQTFESRAKTIASKIESITKEEKESLKTEVEAVNNQLTNGSITKEEADTKKKTLAEARAINIESKVAQQEELLKNLVQEKVDGKIRAQDSSKTITIHFDDNFCNKKNKKGEKRTTTQFVFAAGLNSTISDGKLNDSEYSFMGSHFYEWGFTYNTRLVKVHNLLHAKYGLSLMYNNLRPTDNKSFVINDNDTNLEVNTIPLKDSRFRNVYLVVPVHLEFDFSGTENKGDKRYFKSHQSFRFGIGGYTGINVKSKQILKFEDNDIKAEQKTKGDYNVNNFIYGLSSYVGYQAFSFYVKYDLNPLFKDNLIDENNVSMGLRFDFN